MNILVTGICGFIGSHLAERLVLDGHSVSGIDNFHTGSEVNIKAIKNRIKLYRASAGEVNNLGISDSEVIFHYGIPSSTPMYKENPSLVASSLNEFMALLEYSRKKDCKIVLSSTSSLYNGLKLPHKEDMVISPTDFYSEGRFFMERMANIYNQIYGLNIICLRHFSIYGKNEKTKGKYANIISQFLWDMLENNAPIIYGDGNQTRDFVYIDDVVNANLKAMQSNGFAVFNIGTGKSSTFNNVFSLLNKKLGKNLRPQYVRNKITNYVEHTLADISKSEKILGFRAKVSLEEGIEKLISFYTSK